jgi:HSP20 family molecular chaperone IbpA
MSSPSRAAQGSSPSRKPEIVREDQKTGFLDEFRGLVSRRAYDLFEQFGRSDGNDISHWLQAENELVTMLPEVQEAGGSYQVNVSIPGMSADKIKVYAGEDRAVISAEDISRTSEGATEERQSYYMVRWPESIDPDTCNAQIENGRLTLTAQKAKGMEGSSAPR